MEESLDSHFFVVQDEFGGISHVDASQFDNSSVEKWMADETSNACMLCNIDFHPVFRRRHHCRYCGLLFCGACTDNRTMVNDSVVRVCDACGVILMPPSPTSKNVGLKKWCTDHDCTETFTKSSRSAGIRYLCSTLESELKVSHFNAARTLYKLYRCHAPVMIEHGVPKALIQHSLTCDCENTSLTLSLFVNLYNADSEGCCIDFSNDFPGLDCVKLLRESSPEMKRAVARLIYVLCLKKVISVPDLSELICENNDRWVIAFLLAAQALDTAACGHIDQLVPKLIDQFDRRKGTVASRYFGSMLLERTSHEYADLMLNHNLEGLMNCLSACTPASEDDNRPETQIAVCLSSMVLNLWRYLAANKEHGSHTVLFSQVLMPMFEIIALPCVEEKSSNLKKIKALFVEMLRHIASFDDLKTSVSSDQIITLLKQMSEGNDNAAQESVIVLQLLSQ